jgi:hypothetical protein
LADDAATGECVGVSGVAVERCGDAGQPVFWADNAATGVRVGLLKPRSGYAASRGVATRMRELAQLRRCVFLPPTRLSVVLDGP